MASWPIVGVGRARRRGESQASGRAGRGITLLMSLLIVVPAVFGAAPVALAVDNTPDIAGVWTGSGPGVRGIPHSGTGGLAEFTYNDDHGVSSGVPLEAWDFHTTAATAGTVHLVWAYEGLHAWFNVTAGLDAYRSGSPTTTSLVAAGPAVCCTTPSNGFAYSGSTTLTVAAGEAFGFKITGSNGDSNSFLRGDLRVAMNVVENNSFEAPFVDPAGGGFGVLSGGRDHLVDDRRHRYGAAQRHVLECGRWPSVRRPGRRERTRSGQHLADDPDGRRSEVRRGVPVLRKPGKRRP